MGEELLFGGRLRLRQVPGVFPLSMDTMALADFAGAALRQGQRVWDLGCGSGALGLLLLGQESTLSYTGVDNSPAAVALARENLAENGLDGEIFPQDIGEMWKTAPAGQADLVISNPPYFPAERGKPGTGARTGCTLTAVCTAAGRLLRPGGGFVLCYPAPQLAELFAAMTQAGITPKRLRLAAHSPAAVPKLALVEGRKGGRPGLTLLPNLNWYGTDGTPTADYRRIYHESDPSATEA